MTIQQEKWKPVVGYEGRYEVSDLGRIRSKWFDKILKPQGMNTGYKLISLTVNRKHKNALVHRLVAHAFLESIEGKKLVNHKNGDKSDNRAVNLEWCTYSENIRHAFSIGLMKNISRPAIWRWKTIYARIGCKAIAFASVTSAARTLKLSRSAISNNLTGRSTSCGGYIFEYEN